MLCGKSFSRSGERKGSVPVFLNVYDLTPINGYAYWLGLGVYHSGVQVHNVEYAFGAHDYPTTGIFEGVPKQCEGFTFRKSILIGKTELGPCEVRKVMEDLAHEYKGNAYNLITKNCNHFCNAACLQLTANPIPSWVNRLARIGFLCNCVLPSHICSTKVRHDSSRPEEGTKLSCDAVVVDKRLGDGGTYHDEFTTSSSKTCSSSSSSPTATIITNTTSGNDDDQVRGRSRTRRRRRGDIPPPSPLISSSSSSPSAAS
ncbi:DeSI-like protein At4g17486 [Linum grandiflorum]